MRQTAALAEYPAGRPLNAEQALEYHAARLLLLMLLCGQKQTIRGLTKLAKLDFFVRYPAFFERAVLDVGVTTKRPIAHAVPLRDSAMVRHHYGPWDPRYYQVLPYLEGRRLVLVSREGPSFVFRLTEEGSRIAKAFQQNTAYGQMVAHMRDVKTAFGSKSGNSLKQLIYRVFDKEVADLSRGELIQ